MANIMKNSSCEFLLQQYPEISDLKNFQSTSIANCVFNSFSSYTAIMLNTVTIHAIRKTLSLPKTLKTLLLSLAVSDVSVGLLVQPFYTALLVNWSQHSTFNCGTYKVFIVLAQLFTLASFFGVVAVSVDRFLAIHLHLRYQELVTYKRVVAVVISIWVLSTLFSLMLMWAPPDIRSLFLGIVTVFGLVLTTVVYIKIYLAVRRHQNQIQALQVQQVAQNGEMVDFSRLVKSAVGIFYVYLVFLVCYLPFFISLPAIKILGPSSALKRFYFFSLTLVFLNSSLNPVIYCWKMRHIRHAIMDILRNMSWLSNRVPH
ncbi:adenosine receptor A2a-like [Oculina patagonica]